MLPVSLSVRKRLQTTDAVIASSEEDDPRLRPPSPTIRPPEQSSRVNRADWANLWPETKVHVTRSGGACSKDGLNM